MHGSSIVGSRVSVFHCSHGKWIPPGDSQRGGVGPFALTKPRKNESAGSLAQKKKKEKKKGGQVQRRQNSWPGQDGDKARRPTSPNQTEPQGRKGRQEQNSTPRKKSAWPKILGKTTHVKRGMSRR